jgi:hypothetical protein
LLDDPHHHRRIAFLRFGNQQTNVFRHDNVSMHHKAILAARFFQDFQEQITARCTAQNRLAAVAAPSYKMEIVRAVIPMQSFGHPVR